MRVRFTKMQGAGNDFVVLDETQAPLALRAAQYRFLADRHFGVGADQILSVLRCPDEAIDFEYHIHNADGAQVEQCGNGARCFARFVHDKGLTTKDRIRVKTLKGVIEPELCPDGRVRVDMGPPTFDPREIPFVIQGLSRHDPSEWGRWELPLDGAGSWLAAAAVSMGNPHAVVLVDDVDATPVTRLGPQVQASGYFPQGVNVGFLQVLQRGAVRLRVYERGVGETLSCGSGACAAAVAGMRLGLLDPVVDVHTRGGLLSIAWGGGSSPVWMTGPAVTVFEGEIDVPDLT